MCIDVGSILLPFLDQVHKTGIPVLHEVINDLVKSEIELLVGFPVTYFKPNDTV